jgi:hypothetical protein
MLSCVSPEAVKTEIQGIRNDMGQLEKVAEELSLWRKSVQADTIYYGGAGWVVIGTGVTVFIFVAASLLLVRAFMRRGNMLSLVTAAVQKVGNRSPETILAIKEQIHQEVKEGRCTHEHRQCLGKFAKKMGTFAEQKKTSDVQ